MQSKDLLLKLKNRNKRHLKNQKNKLMLLMKISKFKNLKKSRKITKLLRDQDLNIERDYKFLSRVRKIRRLLTKIRPNLNQFSSQMLQHLSNQRKLIHYKGMFHHLHTNRRKLTRKRKKKRTNLENNTHLSSFSVSKTTISKDL